MAAIDPSNAANSTDHQSSMSSVMELNVGGVIYATTLSTLAREPNSLLAQMFSSASTSVPDNSAGAHRLTKDSKGRYFIDRDGVLFRYVLDFLRNGKLVLPECFHERERLRQEADYFRLSAMSRSLLTVSIPTSAATDGALGISGLAVKSSSSPGAVEIGLSPTTSGIREPGYIVVGYRGTFAFGRDGGVADVKFRKLWRILVSGRVSLCREVFRDSLNESRDVDRGDGDRYTARFFLKHTFIEQAFDALHDAGFRMVGACGSGTNSAGDVKPGMDTEESKWNHYNEFVFCRY